MPAGRPKQPTELKKLKGTYRPDMEAKDNDLKLSKIDGVLFPKGVKISCPKTIKTSYCRKFWKNLTGTLISLKQLSPSDLPDLEHFIIILEALRNVDAEISNTDIWDDKYDFLLEKQKKLFTQYDTLARKYFISPVARQKMVIDELTIKKVETEITKTATAGLLAQRNERRIK